MVGVDDTTSVYYWRFYFGIFGQPVAPPSHTMMMIDIASPFSYSKFDEVKDFPTTYDMWKELHEIHGGDDNVKSAKEESLRG